MKEKKIKQQKSKNKKFSKEKKSKGKENLKMRLHKNNQGTTNGKM